MTELIGAHWTVADEKRAEPDARANGPKRPWLILNVRQKMKIGNRYIFGLCVVAVVIVLPGGAAHAFGASIRVLAVIAVFQLFMTMAFFVTSLVSLAFGIRAAFDKKWRSATCYLGAAAIPMGAWCFAALTNDPGWEAVMGI